MSEFVDPALGIESIGPFEKYAVVMNGWTVPYLDVRQLDDGRVDLILDERFLLTVGEETTPGEVVSFVANAIAVAKGYACHPTKDGWEDEGRLDPPTNPRWPWSHLVSGSYLDIGG